MINIFEALGWLNQVDHCSHLDNEARRLIRVAYRFRRDNSRIGPMLGRLRNFAYSASAPLQRGEMLLCCAALGYTCGWFPQSARDATDAVVSYEKDGHRRATALWMVGMMQWPMSLNHDAYKNSREAREIFQHRQLLFQHFPREQTWYKNHIRQINVDLAARPEEIWTWLNWFEPSFLKTSTHQFVDQAQEKIHRQVKPTLEALLQDLQEAEQQCEGVFEKAELYLEFGLAIYQLRDISHAVELLKKSVQCFYAGLGTYHKQVAARCMLGALEWMAAASRDQAAADWKCSIQELARLGRWAGRDKNQEKREWYAEHHAILRAAWLERSAGRATDHEQNPRTPGPSNPGDNAPTPPSSTPNAKETDLYQDLLSKVLWDRETADRLIEYERNRVPTADRNEVIKRAIERWLRDNQ